MAARSYMQRRSEIRRAAGLLGARRRWGREAEPRPGMVEVLKATFEGSAVGGGPHVVRVFAGGPEEACVMDVNRAFFAAGCWARMRNRILRRIAKAATGEQHHAK